MIAVFAALVALFIGAGPAIAAGPADLCRSGGEGAPLVSAEAVAGAAARAEAAADRRRSGTAGPSELDLLAIPESAEASVPAAIMARYCAASGELMRLDPGGNQVEARQFLASAVNLARASGDSVVQARAAYQLGLVLLVGEGASGTNTRGAARPAVIEPAATITSGDTGADDPCRAIEAPVLRGIGRFLARSALSCAAVRAAAGNDPDRAALAQLRLARLVLSDIAIAPFRAASLRAEAGAAAVEGLRYAARVSDPARRAILTGRLADTLVSTEPRSPALQQAIIALRTADLADSGALAEAAALDGRLLLAAGDWAGAAAAFQEAVFLEGQRSQPLQMPKWLMLLAEAAPERRNALILQAYRALEAIRPLLPLNDPLTEESVFALQMRPVFEAAVATQLSEQGNDPAQIAGVQHIVEAYREAELQSAFGANCVPTRDPVDPAALRLGEVLLYPILLQDRVELLFVSGGEAGARFNRLATAQPVTRAEVARMVDDMVTSMTVGGDERWKDAARGLYDLLVKPIESQLAPGGTLIIVPDGPLRALPFAALMDADGQYLIERIQLALAPALAYSQPGRDRENREPNVVAVSLQREVALPAGTFAKLEGTREEAAAAVGKRGLLIDDFKAADLSRALSRGNVDILHVATHAAFNGRSDRSFIVANGEAIPLADLRMLIGSGRARGDELDLLVLSACETAVGDDLASMGLAGAAVQSGAESAVASLWPVSDIGTVALMKGFYGQYRAGDGKAEALRSAQLALIRQSGELAHPSIWAAFTLLGGWR
ncbi:MAG: CHAT domain-containing protein [Sphingomonadales bacterium]|nr:MAG: CHAT domain-containing protein [Sphingomonadales bacterium]